MDEKLIEQIRENIKSKSTEELLKIWKENDREQYSEEAFEAVKQILEERKRTVRPHVSVSEASGEETDLKTKNNVYKKIRSGYKWNSADEFYANFKDSLSGKRDDWTWFFGIIIPFIQIVVTIYFCFFSQTISLLPHEVKSRIYIVFFLYLAILLAVSLSFFRGKLWARKAYYTVPFIYALIYYVAMYDILGEKVVTQEIGKELAYSFWGLLFYTAIIRSTRNKLFFKLPVSDISIKKYWLAYSNKLARVVCYCAILHFLFSIFFVLILEDASDLNVKSVSFKALLIIFIGVLLAIIVKYSIKARNRSNLDAIPPIGGKNYANAAIGICVFVLIGLFIRLFKF